MPGLESLMQYGYSPFGGTDIMQTIGGAARAYGERQSPEAQMKRVLGDIITGKRSVEDLSPEVRKLLGVGETKEDVLLKRYLQGDKSPEVLEGLGMRVTGTPKEAALEALSTGEAIPGLDIEETKKLAGVLVGEKDISAAGIKTLGEIGQLEAPRGFFGKFLDVISPGPTPYEKLEAKYKGVEPEVLERFKAQYRKTKEKILPTAEKVKVGDTIKYQGKTYKVEGFNTAGEPLIDTSKPLD